MRWVTAALAVSAILFCAGPVSAAEAGPLHLPAWTVLPFVLLLLAIAALPLVAGQFWHKNRNKAMVAAIFAIPVATYLVYYGPATGFQTTHALVHEIEEFRKFILLLAALYTVAGGLVLSGDIRGTPLANGFLLAFGAVLANLIGTTGASMVLIRPFLRINGQRQHTRHLPIFFIFLVSNLGGLLTPLGDPPLFLGFLRGVAFFWTLQLWPQWLVANGVVLGAFLVWDTLAYWREPPEAKARDRAQMQPLRLAGTINLILLAGIVAAILFHAHLPNWTAAQVAHMVENGNLQALGWACVPGHASELIVLGMGLVSLLLTRSGLRQLNGFSWGPILEVAILFAGIFVAMVPALKLLEANGPLLKQNVQGPWQFFWITGALSSFLDNAPTYLTFATLAASPHEIDWLVANQPALLQAISCGAVFMGAMTYIGNGPNFMVKAIADAAGYRTPSFFGYLAYSCLILLPTFGLVTYLFFRPA